MTTPQAARADILLFNKIGDLASDDVAGHAALLFPLRKELHRDRNNPVVRAALARVLLMMGHRAEALDHLGSFMGMLALADPPELDLAASMFIFSGEWEKAEQLRQRLSLQPGASRGYFSNAVFGAFMTGDTAVFDSLISEHAQRYPDIALEGARIRSALVNAELWPHLREHFLVIRKILAGSQCRVARRETPPEFLDGMETQFTDHYLDLPLEEVMALSRTLSDALCDYYQSVGMEPGCWVGVLQPVLHSIETQPL